MPRTSDTPPCSLISETSTHVISLTPTYGVVGSRVRTSPPQGPDLDWLDRDPVYGGLGGSLYAVFDPESCSWRTPQTSLFADLIRSSDALPRSGTTQAGRLFGRQTLGRRTIAPACGWWPTPIRHDRKRPGERPGRHGGTCLYTKLGGMPHPEVSEWLMGLPRGWTDPGSGPSETPSSRRSSSGSAGASSPPSTRR